jgi:ssDNA-binding Zn-finger/Zn-ribbon topoisomerase 1
MAERLVVDCDKCGKETQTHIKINIPNGSKRTGPSGYPDTDYLYEDRDLCPTCAANLLKFMLGHRKFRSTELGRTVTEFKYDKVHPEGNQETDAILLARKYFGIKEP